MFWWWLCNNVNTFKTSELYTLRGWMLRYVNYIWHILCLKAQSGLIALQHEAKDLNHGPRGTRFWKGQVVCQQWTGCLLPHRWGWVVTYYFPLRSPNLENLNTLISFVVSFTAGLLGGRVTEWNVYEMDYSGICAISFPAADFPLYRSTSSNLITTAQNFAFSFRETGYFPSTLEKGKMIEMMFTNERFLLMKQDYN